MCVAGAGPFRNRVATSLRSSNRGIHQEDLMVFQPHGKAPVLDALAVDAAIRVHGDDGWPVLAEALLVYPACPRVSGVRAQSEHQHSRADHEAPRLLEDREVEQGA